MQQQSEDLLLPVKKLKKFHEMDLWNLVNVDTPQKRLVFNKVEILLSIESLLNLLPKIPEGSLPDIMSEINYIKDRGVILPIFESFPVSKQDIVPKKRNWSQEETEKYLDLFMQKKEEHISNQKAMEEEELNEEWEDASIAPSKNDDDIIYMDDEELKKIDEEVFVGESEHKEEDEPKLFSGKPDNSDRQYIYHKDFVVSIAINPSNPLLFASGSGDETGLIWDLSQKDPIKVLKSHTDTINIIKYNFDGSLIATCSLDNTIKIWDSNGQILQNLEGPSDEIRFIDWHKKGNALVGGSADNTVWLWNATSGTSINIFQGHLNSVNDGGFTYDGKFIVSVGEDKFVRVWSPKTGECLEKIGGHGFHDEGIICLDFNEKNPIIVTGGSDGYACLCNYSNGKILGKTNEHNEDVECVLFSKKNDHFFTAAMDGEIRIYDYNNFKMLDKLNLNSSITKLSYDLNDPNRLIASTIEGSIHYFDYRKKGTDKIEHNTGSTIHDFEMNSRQEIICGCEDGMIKIFEMRK